MNNILNPILQIDINTYFSTILTVSGILLGLIFSALTYILQNGFSSFKFNRVMFLKLYIAFGKQLLYILSYVTIISLFRLFFNNILLLSLSFYFFSIIFIKSFLDYYKHKGYIHTIFSKKFIPRHYGKIRAYFRCIRNLGIVHNLWILFLLFVFIVYPIVISFKNSKSFYVTDNSLIISSLIFLVYSIVIIGNFIPQFFDISIMEYDSIIESENPGIELNKKVDIDYLTEKRTLISYFESNEIIFDVENKQSILDGEIFYTFDLDDKPEAWIHITIEKIKSDVQSIRLEVERIAYNLFSLFEKSNSDINSFVLSFHIYLKPFDHRNIFLRSNRNELKNIINSSSNPKEFVKSLKNKLFDDLFRDL